MSGTLETQKLVTALKAAAESTRLRILLLLAAGELNVKLSNRVSVRSDVPPAPGAPTLTSVEMVNYDRDWAAANKDRILKLWQTTVGL